MKKTGVLEYTAVILNFKISFWQKNAGCPRKQNFN